MEQSNRHSVCAKCTVSLRISQVWFSSTQKDTEKLEKNDKKRILYIFKMNPCEHFKKNKPETFAPNERMNVTCHLCRVNYFVVQLKYQIGNYFIQYLWFFFHKTRIAFSLLAILLFSESHPLSVSLVLIHFSFVSFECYCAFFSIVEYSLKR